VVGLPDSRYGQRVAAVVAAASGSQPDPGALAEYVGQRLAGYKKPRRIVFVPGIRRSPSGKADLGWAQSVAAAEAPPGDADRAGLLTWPDC
jgi:fatty-acyl-CoA synthase